MKLEHKEKLDKTENECNNMDMWVYVERKGEN